MPTPKVLIFIALAIFRRGLILVTRKNYKHTLLNLQTCPTMRDDPKENGNEPTKNIHPFK